MPTVIFCWSGILSVKFDCTLYILKFIYNLASFLTNFSMFLFCFKKYIDNFIFLNSNNLNIIFCFLDLEDTNKSLKAMHDIVCSLPQPNRDTLAFLILHLQRFVLLLLIFIIHFSFKKIPYLSREF